MTDQTVDLAVLDRMGARVRRVIGENAQFLTDLDAAIGDADHGINMDRGMTAVIAALDEAAPADIAALCKQVGMTLVKSVGGASGPLYGTFFLRMATALGAVDTRRRARASPRRCAPVSTVWCSAAVPRRATRRCSTRWPRRSTRSTRRWHPASGLAAALQDATVAAEKGRDATESMVARKGRASYLGQRSVGHQDPGATSAAMLIAAAATGVRRGGRVTRVSATVGLVVVSHSRALARAAVALAQEMLHGKQIRIAIAAGLDDTTFGTDAAQIVDAITAADHGAGVVVLMDLGSAVLSAELALELLDDDVRDRVVLCPAPLVEGLVVARGRGGRRRRHRRGRRRSGGRAGRKDRPPRVRAGAPAAPTRRRRRRADRQLRRHQPARAARPAGRTAGAGGAPSRRPRADPQPQHRIGMG